MPSFLSFDEVKQFYICKSNKMKQSELLFQFLANLRDNGDIIKSSLLALTESLLELEANQILELNAACKLFQLEGVNHDLLLRQLMECPVSTKFLSESYYDVEYLDNFRFHLRRYEASKDQEQEVQHDSDDEIPLDQCSDATDVFKGLEKYNSLLLDGKYTLSPQELEEKMKQMNIQ